MTIWGMRITCSIPKATNIHSEYVTLIAFPLQQWLHQRASCYVIRTLPVLLTCSAAVQLNYPLFWHLTPRH